MNDKPKKYEWQTKKNMNDKPKKIWMTNQKNMDDKPTKYEWQTKMTNQQNMDDKPTKYEWQTKKIIWMTIKKIWMTNQNKMRRTNQNKMRRTNLPSRVRVCSRRRDTAWRPTSPYRQGNSAKTAKTRDAAVACSKVLFLSSQDWI